MKYPEATVGALIFNERDEIFLMKTHKWNGKYCIPGGHIEFGEKAIEAVRREVKEETNLDIKEIEFHILDECISSENFHIPEKHFIFLDFTCRAISNEVILNDEGSDYCWASLKELSKYDIEPYTLNTIRLYIKKLK